MLARRRPPAAVALMATFVAAPALGQVFKCVDASGRVTYQQTPCPSAQRGGPLDLFLDNGSGRDSPEVEGLKRLQEEQEPEEMAEASAHSGG